MKVALVLGLDLGRGSYGLGLSCGLDANSWVFHRAGLEPHRNWDVKQLQVPHPLAKTEAARTGLTLPMTGPQSSGSHPSPKHSSRAQRITLPPSVTAGAGAHQWRA